MNDNDFFANKTVLGGIAGLVIIAAAAAAYFLFAKGGDGMTTVPATSASIAGTPASVCDATLAMVQNYGVVPPATSLVSGDAQQSGTKGREVCRAQSGSQTYSMSVDVLCSDMADEKCLKLFSVTRGDGTSLYQRQG